MRRIFAFCVFLLALAAPALADQHFAPALFVARDADSTLYLYGTVHVRRPGAPWGGADAQRALRSAEEVWTELEMSPEADARAQAEVAQRAVSSRALDSYLSKPQRDRLKAALVALDVDPNYFAMMRPWFAGIMLSVLPVMRAGYDPQAGVDRQIDAIADAAGLRARWFETSAQQFDFFEGFSEALQIEMLMEGADAAIEGVAQLEEMERAWERGDLATLERLVIDETRTAYPELYEALFVRRNAAWTRVLVQEMRGSGVDFVAVGAGHLLGDEGLVAMLRAQGVRVERVGR